MARNLDPAGRVRSARAGVRRQLVRTLRVIQDDASSLVRVWSTRSTVWLHNHERTEPGEYERWRRWEEYPENDPAVIAATARRLRHHARYVYQLAEILDREYQEAELAVAVRKREEVSAREHEG